MTLRKLSPGLSAILAMVTQIISAAPALAQAKPEPVFQIQACTTYLRLSAAQRKFILAHEESLTKLQSERAAVMNPAASQGAAAGSESQSAAPPAPAPANPQLAKLYDDAVGKVENELAAKRKLLAMIESEYRECLKTPPQRAAKAEPPPARKEAVKRKASQPRASRSASEEQRSKPPSGGIGIFGGGGGIGIGF